MGQKSKREPTRPKSIRLPIDLLSKIEAEAKRTDTNATQVIRWALREYFEVKHGSQSNH